MQQVRQQDAMLTKLSKSIKHPNALPIAVAVVFINFHTNHVMKKNTFHTNHVMKKNTFSFAR
jgi:hypothetical protein